MPSCNLLDNYAVPTVPVSTSLVPLPLSQLKRSSVFSCLQEGHGGLLLHRRNIRLHAAKMSPCASKSSQITHILQSSAVEKLITNELSYDKTSSTWKEESQPWGFILRTQNLTHAFGKSFLPSVRGSTLQKEGNLGFQVSTTLSSKSQVILGTTASSLPRRKCHPEMSADVCGVEAHTGWQSSLCSNVLEISD